MLKKGLLTYHIASMLQLQFNLSRLKANIINLRLQHRFTTTEVAQKIGLTREGIVKWEDDPIRVPSIENLIALCNLYEVTLDDMLFSTINPPEEDDSQGNNLSFAEYVINKDKLFQDFYNNLSRHLVEHIKVVDGLQLSPVISQTTSKYVAFKTYYGKTVLHFLSTFPSKNSIRCIFSIPSQKITHPYLSYSRTNAIILIEKIRDIKGDKLLIQGHLEIDYTALLNLSIEVIRLVIKQKGLN